jgi:aminopeptidase N
LDAFVFKGSCSIEFKVVPSKLVSENNKSITLHAKELGFISASYTQGSTKVKADEIRVNLKATTVEFVFGKEIDESIEQLMLTIEYSGLLNNEMAGFYRSSYTDINGQSKIMASTQFESLDARRAFPCVDEPAAKALFSVALTIPHDRICFSNMPERSIVSLSERRKMVTFLDTPKMSTYLLAFCVGEFDCVQERSEHGVLVKVYTPPGKSANGQFALQTAVRALDAYDDFFQVPYPLPKLDMVAIPEFGM